MIGFRRRGGSCHDQVDQMEVVYQEHSLSMGWCLECHRAPEKHLRPLEEVYNLKYDPEKYINAPENAELMKQLGVTTTEDLGLKLKEHWDIQTRESCATCHH